MLGTLTASTGAVMNIGASILPPTSAPTAPMTIETMRPRSLFRPTRVKASQPTAAPVTIQTMNSMAPCCTAGAAASVRQRTDRRAGKAQPATMKLPEETSPFLWGAVAGAVALWIVGFAWGGWVTGGTAALQAKARASEAMVAALVPICVAQFQKSPKSQASLAALKATQSWQQPEYVIKNGWATMPGGSAEPDRDVASACAEAIGKLAP